MFLFRSKNRSSLIDKSNLLEITLPNRQTLYVTGFEVYIVYNSKNEKKAIDSEIYSRFITAIRSKMKRSSSIYIVTNISKHLGGTALLCIDKDQSIYLLCQIAATTLETISNNLIKTKELKPKDILKYLDPSIKVGKIEVPILNNLMNEHVEYSEVPIPNYSFVSDTHEPAIPLGETSRARFVSQINLPLKNIVRHIAIFGSTGSGKTTTATSISIGASIMRACSIILDWHGEYLSKINDVLTINRYLGLEVIDGINIFKTRVQKDLYLDVVEILEPIIDLTPSQYYILSQALKRLKRKVEFSRYDFLNLLRDLNDEIEHIPEESRWYSESKMSIIRKLGILIDYLSKFNDPDNAQSFLNQGSLNLKPGKILIIDLSKIDKEIIKSLVSLLVLRIIENHSKYISELKDLYKLIVIDEAQHIFRREEGKKLPRDLLSEIRKWNVGLLVISQSPTYLGDDALKNTNTKLIHAIKSDTDIKILKESMSLKNSIEELLPYLDVGEAIYSSPTHPFPIPIRIYEPPEVVSKLSK